MGREEGKKFASIEFWVSFGKEKTGGEGNGVQKRGSCFFAMEESVAKSYGALQHFGHREKGGKSGGNRTGVSNLQQADAEVGRCA